MPSRTTWFVASVVAVSAFGMGRAAAAQPTCSGNPCTVPLSGTVTVNSVGTLALSGGGVTSLNNPRAADFVAGFRESNGPSLTVRANASMRVVVTGAAWTVPAGVTKPIADMLWSKTSGTGYVALTTAGADFLSSAATAGLTQAVFYRTLWKFTQDRPGSYSMGVKYTLVSP